MTLTAPDGATRTRCLHEQHRNWQRSGYDGHNRRSGLTPMSTLRGRRMRRRMHRSLAWLAQVWDAAPRRYAGAVEAYTALGTA